MKNLFQIRRAVSRRARIVAGAGAFVALGAVWTLAVLAHWASPIFLPSPWQVAQTAWDLYAHGGMVRDVGVSVYRVLTGFVIASAIAVPLGLMMGTLTIVRAAFEPMLAFVRYMPATAFIPLLVLWLGIGDAQKFAVVYLGTFFHLALLVTVSVQNVPLALIESAQMLGGRRRQIVVRVIWAAARPHILDNVRIVLGWAWTYIVVAEIVAADSGVGYQILKASRFLDVSTIFVGIVSIGAVGIVSDQILLAASRLLFPYLQPLREGAPA
ncbi:MAG: ABC transporter permease [Burkholderia sp.]